MVDLLLHVEYADERLVASRPYRTDTILISTETTFLLYVPRPYAKERA